jgi:hypothetical protein
MFSKSFLRQDGPQWLSKAIGYGMDERSLILVKGKDFSSHRVLQTRRRIHLTSYPMEKCVFYPISELLKREALS